MTDFLVAHFIRDYQNVQDKTVRERYGVFSSMVGIFCNILLFLAKLLLGLFSGSVAVMADAFNNLSDVGSSAVSLLGFKMAGKPADKDHPFGHGRIEYLSGLVIAAVILLVGAEFIKSSVNKIINPVPISFSWIVLIGLVLSIGVKFWMNRFNRSLSKKIGSTTLEAVALDSISDVLATSVTLLSVILSRVVSFPVDGIMGFIVACFILFSGYKVAKDTISPLLGKAPDPELVQEITNRITSFPGILGIHDLILHDYGPGRVFASVHAEIPDNITLNAAHEIIDTAEREISAALDISLLIHIDPVDLCCKETSRLKGQVCALAKQLNPQFTLHDFRLAREEGELMLMFDLLVPFDSGEFDEQILLQLNQRLKEIAPDYRPVIKIEHGYL